MGAAYVLTGSINQACVESGTSDAVRRCSPRPSRPTSIMAPAADMFEMGVKVQVLKRGTMFAMRAAQLYELYRAHASLEEIPAAERATLEKNVLPRPARRDLGARRALLLAARPGPGRSGPRRDPKHRWPWSSAGISACPRAGPTPASRSRQLDYQVWCGPAMGAFNEWTRGTDLERPENRHAATVAQNLLHGACVLQRAEIARVQGVRIDDAELAKLTRPLLVCAWG